MKKYLLLLIISALLIFISCDDGGSSDEYEPYTALPDIVGGYHLKGQTEIIDSSDFLKSSEYEGNLEVTSPSAAHIKIDGYVHVTGINNSYNPLYIGIADGNTLTEIHPVSIGNFDKYLYFRTKVTRDLIFCHENSEDSYSVIALITVTNTNEKIKYLVPSPRVQAFDSSIIDLAEAIKSTVFDDTDIESIARAVHDHVAKDLFYDFDSLVVENRKAQDALSVLNNGMAVCEGYATLYAALLRSLGIKTQVYTGSNHAWNKVYWSGRWHDVDVTWDDPNLSEGGKCNLTTGEFCNSDYSDGRNVTHNYFDTGFTGEEGHIGLVNDYYKK